MSGRVLITGASGALGRSVVERFVAGGDRVLAVGATDAALAPADKLAIRRADLASTPEVERLFDEEESNAGVPRAVVHLVGGFRWSRFADLSDADWNYLMKLNLETTFRVFRECARRFERAGGGVVVAVASPAAFLGEAGVGGGAPNRAAMPNADPAKWARTEDVAAVIHFLTTPAAVAVNGAAVQVPGPTL
jgi:NAD(P)-dependent dehydrogenase (short-subunit alcohol dehydrogenase family)